MQQKIFMLDGLFLDMKYFGRYRLNEFQIEYHIVGSRIL
jgi:hypothetical protein